MVNAMCVSGTRSDLHEPNHHWNPKKWWLRGIPDRASSKVSSSYDGVDEAVAATAACSGITAYSALKKVRHLRSDESLLIVGAGGVGLAGIGMAKAVVKAKIIVAEIDPAKRAAAREAGADVSLTTLIPLHEKN